MVTNEGWGYDQLITLENLLHSKFARWPRLYFLQSYLDSEIASEIPSVRRLALIMYLAVVLQIY